MGSNLSCWACRLSRAFIAMFCVAMFTPPFAYSNQAESEGTKPGTEVIEASDVIAASSALPRVVSINICADQWLMLLAEPVQIAALSNLSRDEHGSYFHREAQHYPQAEPTAENLLALQPDIVITGPYTSRHTLSLLGELGISVETLPVANSFEDMLSNAELVGRLLRRDDQAAAIVRSVRGRLQQLKIKADGLRKTGVNARIAVYDANGYTVGRQTIRGEAIEFGGWHNIASEVNIQNYGVLGLEQLLWLSPQAFLASPYSSDTYSRAQYLSQHPAIRQSGLNPEVVNVPSTLTLCAGPWTVDVVEQLIEAHPAGRR